MNPESNTPSSPEVSQANLGESLAPEQAGIEQGAFDQAEKFEQKSEQPTSDNAAPAALPPVIGTAAPVADPAVTDDKDKKPDANPETARHGDQIEKEWVAKAKQILNETRDDPHDREEKVSALQADYLKKRYNRTIGDGS